MIMFFNFKKQLPSSDYTKNYLAYFTELSTIPLQLGNLFPGIGKAVCW